MDGELISWEQDNADPGVIPHPHYRKMTADDDQIALWNSDRTTFIVRYAEVLLTYAEAQARAGGSPNADAYSAVNKVRNRAGLADLTPGLNGEAFADSVVQERAWEFAGFEYAARWYDLVRLEMVEEANSDANRVTQDDVAEGQPYDFDVVGDISNRRNWFAPYPTSEVQQNSNLSNN